MKQKINLKNLKHTDDKTANMLSDLFPANWEMNDIFRTSWQKYQEQSQKTVSSSEPDYQELSQQKNKVIRKGFYRNIVLTAACFLLIAGTFKTIIFLCHSVPKKIDTMERETETITETAESIQSETIALESVNIPKETEITIISAETSPIIISSETQTVTAQFLETVTTTSEEPSFSDIETISFSEIPISEITPVLTETEPFVSLEEPPEVETFFSELVSSILTEVPSQDETFSSSTELISTETEPIESLAESEMPSTAEPPSSSEPTVTGFFTIEHDDEESKNTLYYTAPDEIKQLEYTFSLEGYSISDKSGSYIITEDATGTIYSLYQMSYERFYFRYPAEENELTPVEINGRAGFLVQNIGFSFIIWDDGGNICLLTAMVENPEQLIPIAQAFKGEEITSQTNEINETEEFS